MQPRTVAIYRVLYGSDFIGESIASIYDHVDQILCLVTHEVFGGRKTASYFGHDLYFPHDFDGTTEAIHRWKREKDHADKIRVRPNPYGTILKGQMGRIVNDLVIPSYDCTHVLLVEADEVWHEDTIAHLMDLAAHCDADEFVAPGCHLFWRTPRFVSTRTNPYTVLRALKGKRSIGPTGHVLAEIDPNLKRLADPRIRIHNFGYAASARTVFWKHIAALSFSRDARLDSPPREDWFETVWRAWNWHSNRRTDLCPSIGYPDVFAPAQEYPFEQLPSQMRRRIAEAPVPDWEGAEAGAGVGAREAVAV